MIQRRGMLTLGAFALGLAIPMARPALAQSAYPAHPIKLIVPFPPGGVYDAISRPLADRLKRPLGSVVIENVGGAGGSRGVTMAARAAPDGYTILLGGTSGFVITPIAAKRPLYDPVQDFEPVARIAVVALSFVVHPSLPVQDLEGLIAHARADASKVSFGTPGVGTTNHFTGEMFKSLMKLPGLAHVPYTGAGPALNDLVGGHIPLVIANVTGQVLSLRETGKIRMLAVTGPRRLDIVREVPTAEEAGVAGLVSEAFFALFAPKGTPKAFVERVAAAVNKVLTEPELRALYVKAGFQADLRSGPVELRAFMREEIARWRPIIEATGYRID